LEAPRYASSTPEGPRAIALADDRAAGDAPSAIQTYVTASPNWELVGRRDRDAHYELEWRILGEQFQSDLPTKRSAVIYFYCWIITAPIGTFYANVMHWHATDFLEMEIALKDPQGKQVYKHKKGLTTSEYGKNLPHTAELSREMRKLTATNLVTLMLNRMERVVLEGP